MKPRKSKKATKDTIDFPLKRTLPRSGPHTALSAVIMRYGEYGASGQTYMTLAAIGRRLRLHPTTVFGILQRYRDDGCVIYRKRPRKQPPDRILTPDQVKWICAPSTLQQMVHLSLGERVRVIAEHLQVSLHQGELKFHNRQSFIQIPVFTEQWLGKVYKANGVARRKTSYALSRNGDEDDLVRLRVCWCNQLVGFLMSGQEVIYYDETTINVWQHPSKIWQPKEKKIWVPLASTKPRHRTVLGAISSLEPWFFWTLGHNTSTETTIDYFEQLAVARMVDGDKRKEPAIVVLDNHSGHTSERTVKKLQALGFIPFFLPPGSSQLNPIEVVWAIFKGYWRKKMIERRVHKYTNETLDEAINMTLQKITPVQIKGIQRAAFSTMKRVLEGEKDALPLNVP